MKRLTLIAGLIASVALVGLHAQSWRMTANIPFSFQAGDKHMPAGEYTLNTTSGVLTLRGAAGNVFIASTPASPERGLAQGSLVFNKYGDEYFLAKVKVVDGYAGHAVRMAPREKELISRANTPQKTLIRAALK